MPEVAIEIEIGLRYRSRLTGLPPYDRIGTDRTNTKERLIYRTLTKSTARRWLSVLTPRDLIVLWSWPKLIVRLPPLCYWSDLFV
jgi:hypothetical protein